MRTEAFPIPEPLRSVHHQTVHPTPTIDCAFPVLFPKVAVIPPSLQQAHELQVPGTSAFHGFPVAYLPSLSF